MTLNVGVIGVGMIGQDHIRRFRTVVSGAQVVAVSDVDADRAGALAADIGAKAHSSGEDLIHDSAVDAVVVTSWGPTHEPYVLASIAAGKPVFCEKPLATTREACERIIDAEVAGGRRLVQVGFMRRYDPQYRAMKEVVRSGRIGAPLVVHASHRNPSVPGHYTSDMVINDTVVHDIDTARWLLDDEIAALTVLKPRVSAKAAAGFNDPLIVLLEMRSGVLVDVEASVNAAYGYDIRGEVLGEEGTVELSESSGVIVKHEGSFSGRVPMDWKERFARAFDVEFAEWVDAVSSGAPTGPSAWDGYAATATAAACLEALHSGTKAKIQLESRPALYGQS